MISNEKQYKITQEKADGFVRAIEEFDVASGERTDVHPRLLKAEREAMESQLEDLRREIAEYERLRSSASTKAIPMAVCSVVGRLLGDAYYSHSRLNALFFEAGAPGDAPLGNCVTKCTSWLKRCNDDPETDALAVLGNVLVDFMEAWPVPNDPDHLADKAAIEQKLAEYGLRYHGGRVFSALLSPSTGLESIIRSFDSVSLGAEFDWSLHTIESDPEAAITAANAAKAALSSTDRTQAAREMAEAIGDISRRPDPDVTGAVHHAMAALEATARDVTGQKNPTLGQLVERLELKPPLDAALQKLWGYASNEARHGREDSALSATEAKLIVGVSGAVCSYLVEVNRHPKS